MNGSNLYSFARNQCGNAGAPQLVPVNQNYNPGNNSNNYIFRDSLVGTQPGVIDVVNTFQWTDSPPGLQSRQEVPGIYLREKRIKVNSMVAAAAYFLMSGMSSLGTLAARGGSAINNLFPGATSGLNGIFNNIINTPGISNVTSGIGSFFEQTILNTASTLTTGNSDIRSILAKNIEGLNSSYLKSYEGLYITEDTKFTYYLPYFTDTWNQVMNNFSENLGIFEGGNFAKGLNMIQGAAESLAAFANFKEPGIYIERPKFYSFPGSGDVIEIKFPLINTGNSNHDDVRRNWQLVFMLTYQNRPNRRSRELIDPACIYEINIPGTKYLPYAWMREIKIDFVGARRTMPLSVPVLGGFSTIDAIVPDAYMVSITLEGLIAESQNFLAAMLTDKQDIISVQSLDRFNPFGEAFESFTQSFNREASRIGVDTR